MATTSFPGRIVIDHRPKTGGQALTAWLVDKLGAGCVSPNLAGGNSELIKLYGGIYSIISGHINFLDRGVLDPRYQYITCLREPVDRVLSWLFFVLDDATIAPQSEHVRLSAEIFFRSEGKECPDDLLSDYSNHYINHFSTIHYYQNARKGDKNSSDDDKLETALAAICHYDIIGTYEDFPGYLIDVAGLIGIDAPAEIPRVNVSTRRRRNDGVSPTLRERIIELNQHDIRFYNEIIKWKTRKTLPTPLTISKPISGWVKYDFREPAVARDFSGSVSLVGSVPDLLTDEQKILSIEVRNRSSQNWGDDPSFPVRVSYHWMRPSGEIYLYDGQRTFLPNGGIPTGSSLSIDMSVAAPSEAGVYTLIVSLVQEGFFWFERKGFEPGIIQVVVKGPGPEPRRRGWLGLVDRVGSILESARHARLESR